MSDCSGNTPASGSAREGDCSGKRDPSCWIRKGEGHTQRIITCEDRRELMWINAQKISFLYSFLIHIEQNFWIAANLSVFLYRVKLMKFSIDGF